MVLYARDIVESDFLSLQPTATVLEGARSMKWSRHGFVVIGAPSSPVGIVTEWDVISKVVAEGKDPANVTLEEIMSGGLVFVEGDMPISAVSQLMTEKGVRRLLVKQEGKVVGAITAKTMMARLNEYVDKISAQIGSLQAPWY